MIVLIFAMLLCCGFSCSVRVVFVSRLTAPASCAGSDVGPAGPEDRNNKRISKCRPRTAQTKRLPGGPGRPKPANNYGAYGAQMAAMAIALHQALMELNLDAAYIE